MDYKNIRVLRAFRGPDGEHMAVGRVFPKTLLDKADWSNLCNMTPPRAEETDAAVTKGAPVVDEASPLTKLPVV